MRLLQDKVVFITGSSRGIGREIALKFAFSGNTLINEDFLRDENFSDFSHYAIDPRVELAADILID